MKKVKWYLSAAVFIALAYYSSNTFFNLINRSEEFADKNPKVRNQIVQNELFAKNELKKAEIKFENKEYEGGLTHFNAAKEYLDNINIKSPQGDSLSNAMNNYGQIIALLIEFDAYSARSYTRISLETEQKMENPSLVSLGFESWGTNLDEMYRILSEIKETKDNINEKSGNAQAKIMFRNALDEVTRYIKELIVSMDLILKKDSGDTDAKDAKKFLEEYLTKFKKLR